MPKISVVMPVFNVEKYVREAIESILNQTFKDFELVIVNDASTDNTADILQEYSDKDSRVKIITNAKNLNIGGSLNKGVSVSSSELIARMDADDVCMENRLEEQVNLMEKNNKIAVSGSYIQLIDEFGKELYIRTYPIEDTELKKKMLLYSPFAHPSVVFRKKVFEEIGGYDPTKSPSEDIDLWFRIGVKHKFANIPKPLLKYRVFTSSSSNKKLRKVEFNTIKTRYNAVKNLGYKVRPYDIIYNVTEFLTIYLMPLRIRIWLFNYLRKKRII